MTIRTKLILLFTISMAVLCVIGFYTLQVYKTTLHNEQQLSASINQSVELSHQAETLINIQLNTWKNVLLRSLETDGYYTYLKQFYDAERKARQAIKSPKENTSGIKIIQARVEKLVLVHKQIGKKFRKAIRVFNDTQENPATVADRFMADIESEPIFLVNDITTELLNYREQQLSALSADREEQETTLFLSLFVLILAMLFIYLWLVDKNIGRPAERANYLADVIQNAQRVAKFGTWDWDSSVDRHFWSDGLYRILGISRDLEPSLQLFLSAIHEDDRDRVKHEINTALEKLTQFELEARIRVSGGSERVFQQRGEVTVSSKTGDTRLTSIIYDITERKESEQRLAHLANYDTLTGLPNRHLFHDRLSHAMAQAGRKNHQVALLYMDLDHFKSVNDALGHHAGDELLMEAARRIQQNIRESDTAARLGGDEFTVILEQFDNTDQVSTVATHILRELNKVYHIESNEIFVSASIGITLYPDDGDNPEVLLQNADSAMYLAKEEGRNTYHFFTEELNRQAQEKLKLENGLRMALKRDEFQLYFQPQIELSSGRVIGAEALLRWSPNQNMISPARFIPVLEETGLIVPVGKWVLEQACNMAKQVQSKGFRDFRIAVNLAARQLRQADLVTVVKDVLESSGLAPNFLEIELTESTLVDESLSKTNLQQLEKLGIMLAIDDFGTGYSSLSYLKRYAVDILKIDRSFIADIAIDSDDDAVTSAIIALSHQLDIQTVAEGIETPQQMDFLKRINCDIGQGFMIARPMDQVQFEKWLTCCREQNADTAFWKAEEKL